MSADAQTSLPRRGVVIIGGNSLQNRLLAGLIEERCGCSCLIRATKELDSLAIAANTLALLDIESAGPADISTQLSALACRAAWGSIALINADDSVAVQQIVSCPGVKGVFLRDTSQESLVKGIQAIFDGDYWLPRKILCEHLERTRGKRGTAVAAAALLTPKELETLKLLATGHSTDHIANRLNVSPHTVKTHIYRVFRKIRVRNRVQAAQWAMQNIAESAES